MTKMARAAYTLAKQTAQFEANFTRETQKGRNRIWSTAYNEAWKKLVWLGRGAAVSSFLNGEDWRRSVANAPSSRLRNVPQKYLIDKNILSYGPWKRVSLHLPITCQILTVLNTFTPLFCPSLIYTKIFSIIMLSLPSKFVKERLLLYTHERRPP